MHRLAQMYGVELGATAEQAKQSPELVKQILKSQDA
jgi:hypothetical protein